MLPKSSPGVGAVSSTMEVDEASPSSGRKGRSRREPVSTTCGMNGDARSPDCDGIKDEPADFIETNCHWTDCGIEFISQHELVKVSLSSNLHRYEILDSI